MGSMLGIQLVLVALFFGVSSSSAAYELTPLAGVSLSYTDNAKLTSDDKVDDWILGAYAGLDVTYDAQNIESSGFATVSHEQYQNDSFNSATYLNLEGDIAWTILEDRIVLEILDHFSQKPVQSINSEIPDNNQDVNAFSIGPLFTLPVSSRSQLVIHPVFRDYYFETSRIDNERYLLYTKWRYLLQPGREFGFHVDAGKVDYSFDEAGDSPDFETRKIYFSFTSQLRLAEYSLRLGVTNIDRKVFFDHDGFYGRFNWVSEVSESSKLSIRLVTDLTDNGTGLLDVIDRLEDGAVIGRGINIGSSEQLAADIMRNSQMSIAYRRQGSLMRTSLLMRFHNLDYKEKPLDRDVFDVEAVADYAMSAILSARLRGSFRRTKLKDTSRDDDLYSLGLGLTYSLSRQYSLGFDLTHYEKSSSSNINDYSENRAMIRLNYANK